MFTLTGIAYNAASIGFGQKTGISMRLCASQWLLIAVVILLGLSSMLSGCGKKGSLYLPEEPARQADPDSNKN